MFRHLTVWLLAFCVILGAVLSQEAVKEGEGKIEKELERAEKERAREEAQRQREEEKKEKEAAAEARKEEKEAAAEAQKEEKEAAAEARKEEREKAAEARKEEAEARKQANAEAQRKREEERKTMIKFIKTLRDAQKSLNRELNKAKRMLRKCAGGGKGGKGGKQDSEAEAEETSYSCAGGARCPESSSTMCYHDLCVCPFGLYFSSSEDTCVATCTDYDGTYQLIPAGGIKDNNAATLNGTLEECKAACDNDSQCLNFEREDSTGRCNLHYIGPNAGNWNEVAGWETYQKNCV